MWAQEGANIAKGVAGKKVNFYETHKLQIVLSGTVAIIRIPWYSFIHKPDVVNIDYPNLEDNLNLDGRRLDV